MMSFFAQNACEVAQHVRIDDETGTAAGGALFNQENVPSETMFYSIVHAFAGRGETFKNKTAKDALETFENKVKGKAYQFGGDASTGLGYCTVQLADPVSANGSAKKGA
jgi:CRISPR-associated protein Cmr4